MRGSVETCPFVNRHLSSHILHPSLTSFSYRTYGIALFRQVPSSPSYSFLQTMHFSSYKSVGSVDPRGGSIISRLCEMPKPSFS